MSSIAKTIRKLLSPSDQLFLPLLIDGAKNLKEMSALFGNLIKTDSAHERSALCSRIQELEHKGDDITHTIIKELSNSFLTFIDREDIHALATTTDDIADNMLAAANCIDFYGLTALPAGTSSIYADIDSCITEINSAVLLIHSQHQINAVKKICLRINELDKNADQVFGRSKAQLLASSGNPVEQIKYNEWLDKLENIVKSCDNYSHILDSILVKMR